MVNMVEENEVYDRIQRERHGDCTLRERHGDRTCSERHGERYMAIEQIMDTVTFGSHTAVM